MKVKYYYFYLHFFPKWNTGGEKYHTTLYNNLKIQENVFAFGNSNLERIIRKSNILRFIFSLFYYFKVPLHSYIIIDNFCFLDFVIPIFVNKILRKHLYCVIVHHLIKYERPSRLRIFFEKCIIKNADTIIAVSKSTEEEILKMNKEGKKVYLLPPGLDEITEKKWEINENNNEKYILFVGKVEERKGVLCLIKAINEIKNDKIKLNIVGEFDNNSGYLKKINGFIEKNYLKGRINFCGFVKREELKKYYLNSTIFVLPTLWEGYGIVIAEALSYGIPIISTDIPAIRELIINGVNGILFKPEDFSKLAQIINTIIFDEVYLKELSKNALISSGNLLTWNQVSDILKKILCGNY